MKRKKLTFALTILLLIAGISFSTLADDRVEYSRRDSTRLDIREISTIKKQYSSFFTTSSTLGSLPLINQYVCGPAYGICADASYVYFASGNNVQILDAQTFNLVGEVVLTETRDETMDPVIIGDHLYITIGHGTAVVNVSDRTDPFQVNRISYVEHRRHRGLDVCGDTLYVATGGGLLILDTSVNPEQPDSVGFVKITDGEYWSQCYNVKVNGDYTFMAAIYDPGVSVVDISDPASPVEIFRNMQIEDVYDIATSDSLVFAANGPKGVRVYKFNPTADSSNILTEINTIKTEDAHGFYLRDNLLFIADYSKGLKIVDLSDSLRIIGSLDTPGYADDVWVVAGKAFVADRHEGIQVIDVSQPDAPQLIYNHPTGGVVEDIFVRKDDGLTIIACGYLGFKILDAQLNLLNATDMLGYADRVTVSGDSAYIANCHRGLIIVNISNPTNPVVEDEIPLGNSSREDYTAITYSEGKAYLSIYYDGSIKSVDIQNKTVNQLSYGEGYNYLNDLLVVNDSLMYGLHRYEKKMNIFSISDSSMAKIKVVLVYLGQHPYNGVYGYTLARHDTILLVGGRAITGYTISDPLNPQELFRFRDNEWATDLSFDGRYVAVPLNRWDLWKDGVQVYDLGFDCADTAFVGVYKSGGYTNRVFLHQNQVFCCDGENGIYSVSIPGYPALIDLSSQNRIAARDEKITIKVSYDAHDESVYALDFNLNTTKPLADLLDVVADGCWIDTTKSDTGYTFSISGPLNNSGVIYLMFKINHYTPNGVYDFWINDIVINDGAIETQIHEASVGIEIVNKYILTGVLKNARTHEPLTGVEVWFDGSYYVSTDDSGKYTIPVLLEDNHTVEFRNSYQPNVNSYDAYVINQAVRSGQELTPVQNVAADMDTNSLINTVDVAILMDETVNPEGKLKWVYFPVDYLSDSTWNKAPSQIFNVYVDHDILFQTEAVFTGDVTDSLDSQVSMDVNSESTKFSGDSVRAVDLKLIVDGVATVSVLPKAMTFTNQISDTLVISSIGNNITEIVVSGANIKYATMVLVNGCRPVSVTTVSNLTGTSIPVTYVLEQNFPNPFNPTTTIKYSLPKLTHVKLVLYNSLGQKIRELVNEEVTAGHHAIVWNGKDEGGYDVASGLYFCKLQSNEFVSTIKLSLLK